MLMVRYAVGRSVQTKTTVVESRNPMVMKRLSP